MRGEFVCDLTCHFQQWCSAANGADLFERIIMEQFKNSDPQCTALYVNEQKPTTTLHVGELADDFVLTHKSGCAVHSGGMLEN